MRDHVLDRPSGSVDRTVVPGGSPDRLELQPSDRAGGLAHLLSILSARSLSAGPDGLDSLISRSLADLGRFVRADGCYLYRFSANGTRIQKAFSWGKSWLPAVGNTSDAAVTEFPFSLTHLRWHERGHSTPDGTSEAILRERQVLFEDWGVRSLINSPLLANGRMIGAIGLINAGDGSPVKEDTVDLLRTVGYVLSGAIDRIRREAAFETRKTNFLRLVARLDQAVYRITIADGRCEFIGSSPEQVFGYSAEAFLGKPFFLADIIHPDHRPDFAREWKEVTRGNIRPTYEYRVIDPDGFERWILQSNQVIVSPAGTPVAVEGICQNITARKVAEEKLRRSEERFRAITENATDAIVVIDASAMISYVTPSVEKMLGLKAAELVTTSVMDYIHEDELSLALETLRASLERPREGIVVPDLRVRNVDGSCVWVQGLITNLLDNPAVRGVVVNCRDITLRKAAEAALLRIQEQLEERIDTRTRELAEANRRLQIKQASLQNRTVALQEVLSQVEKGRNELAVQTQVNVDKIAVPILDILEMEGTPRQGHYCQLLRSCLKDITAPMVHFLNKNYPMLTAREQEICRMVRDGFSCKQIASMLCISDQTVLKQRKTIRRKLGLSRKKTNLASFLRSMG